MSINEIISMWDKNQLPTDLAILAAMQNKVETYLTEAHKGIEICTRTAAKNVYLYQIGLFQVITKDIETAIENAIQ